MKKHLYGLSLIAAMLSLLLVFPFLGTFLPGSFVEVAFPDQKSSPFFLKNEQAPIVFVYFGYVGCAHVCTPSLQELAQLYGSLKKIEPNVKVYFLNLNAKQNPESADLFAKGFHPEFKGIYATDAQIQSLSRTYNLAITRNGEEMGHSSGLFLFAKHTSGYVLKNIYTTHPYPHKQIFTHIRKILQ